MNRIVKWATLVLATLFVVTSLGIVVDAKVSSTTPRWMTATRDWAASGVLPGSHGPLTIFKRVLARSLTSASQGQAATVKTDRTSYLPNRSVVVTGTGFMPGEVIQLTFQEIQIQGGYVDAPIITNPVTDANGNFADQSYTTDNHHANIPVQVTAKGLASGATAETTFSTGAVIWTDENKYSLSQGIPIYGAGFTAGATITISVLRPDGVTDTVSPAPVAAHDGTFQTIYMPPPTKPGHYRITATDGNNQALTAVTEADPVALDKAGYDKGSASWGTGNQAGFNEGDWAQYQYTITGVGANVALPSFNIGFDYLTAGHIMVDAFSNFRICVDCPYPSSSNSVLAAGVPRPPSSTVGVGVANASGGTWYDFTPTGTINATYNSGTSVCSGTDAVNTPTTPHCFVIDPAAINATNANFPAVAPNSAGPFQSGTHHYTIFYEAHLAATFTWQSGNENQLGSLALPYGAIPPVDAVPSNGVYGTSQYSTWTTTSFLGSGGGGSNQHFYTDLGGKLTLPIPATTVPTGQIIVTKVTTQSGAGAVFNFNLNSSSFVLDTDAATATINSSITFTNVVPGTYTVAEDTAPAGWAQTNLTCTAGGTVTSPTNPTATIVMSNGVTVTCTYTNSKAGSIVLVKNTHGGDGSFAFSTTNAGGLTDTTLTTSSGTARQTFSNIDSTLTYSITETMPAGWQQGAATVCSGTGNTNTSFTVPFGTTVTCTFDNIKKGTIVLVKNTTGGDGSFAFTTTGGGGLTDTTLTTSSNTATQTFTSIDPTKTFSIAENTPAGWQLITSTCTTGAPASFTVAAGGTTTCTFTNRNQATIVLVKNTTGGDGSFTFTTTGGITNPASVTTNGGTGAVTFSNVDSTKTYSFAENVPTGWQQTGTPSCTGQASGTVGGFVPAAGGTTTCTFANTKQATLILQKTTTGGTGAFAFTASGVANTTLTTATAGVAVAQTYTNVDPTATYSFTEPNVAGWQLTTTPSCTTGSGSGTGTQSGVVSNVTVPAGGTTTCTFANTKQATLILQKTTTGGTGAFAFTASGVANTTLTTATAGVAVARTYTNVDPTATYSFTEPNVPGWQLTTTPSCSVTAGGSGPSGSGSGLGTQSGVVSGVVVGAGQTVTCAFANTKQATLILQKTTTGGTGAFAFTASGVANTTLTTATAGVAVAQTYTNVDPTATYSFTEPNVPGWQLTTTPSCTTGSGSGTGTQSGVVSNVTVPAGGTTTCTFANTKQATLILQKTTTGGTGAFAFTASGVANTTLTTATAGVAVAQTYTNVDPTATYSFTEPNVAGWQLTTTPSCTTGSGSGTGTQSGVVSNVTVPAGGTTTCTFANTKQATLILQKTTTGGTGAFAFTASGVANTTLTTATAGVAVAQTYTNVDPTATYSFTEPNVPGWQLTTTPSCTTGSGSGTGTQSGVVSNVTVPAGGTTTCTFANTKQATLILQKTTTGGTGAFAFTASGVANTTLTTATAGVAVAQTYTNVDPTATYSFTEPNVAGWQLTTTPSCTTGSGSGTGTQSGVVSNVTVPAGGTTTCTFANTKQATLILQKTTTGGTGAFAFTASGVANTTLTTATAGVAVARTYTNVDPTATYSFTEPNVPGWQLTTTPSCTTGSGSGTGTQSGVVSNVTVSAGGTTTCTFANTKQATLILQKTTTGGTGAFAFTASGVANTTLTTATAGIAVAQTYTNVDPTATYSFTEPNVAGWQLTTTPSCTTGSGSGTGTQSGVVSNVTVPAGGTTTCTFANTKQATLILQKTTTGGTGAFAFTASGVANTTLTTATAGVAVARTYTNVDPTATYSFTEPNVPGWQLTTTPSCTTGSGSGTGTQSGVVSNVTVSAGGTTTCTFANTKQATLILQKTTTGGTGAFAFTASGVANTTLTTATAGLAVAQTYTNVDPTATYSFTEPNVPGWQLTTTPSCTTGSGSGTGTQSGVVSNVTVPAGGTTTCTFANTKQATIILVKNTHGGNGSFAFTTNGTGGFTNTTLTTSGGTAARTYTGVDPAVTFSVTEGMPTGWQQGLAPTCSAGTNTSFTVAAGSTVTCTFDNVKNPSLTLTKHVTNVFGGALTTDFTMSATGGPTPISGAGSATSPSTFTAGTYTLNETNVFGYLASVGVSGIWSCTGSGTFVYGTPSAYSAAVTSLSPTAYWKLGELGGSTLTDASGNNHTLKMPAVTFGVPGAIGGGTTGLGLTNSTVWPTTNISAPTGPVSYEFWVKPQVQGGDGYGTLLVDNFWYGRGFYLLDNGSGGVNLDFWDATGTPDHKNTTALKTDGTLYHVVASVSAGGVGTWYVNGVADGTFPYTNAPPATPGIRVDHLFNNDGLEALQVSLIDEIAVYNGTQLSAGQASTHAGLSGAAYSSAVLADGATAYWKLNEATGATLLADASPSNNPLVNPTVTFGVPGAIGGGTTGLSMTGGLAVPATNINIPTGPVTFEWWVKPQTQGGDGYGALLVDNFNFGSGFYLLDNGPGSVKPDFWYNGIGDQVSTVALTTGSLYHIVASVTGAGAGTWYVNGVAAGTFTYSALRVDHLFNNDALEALHASLIDEIAIYPSALDGATALSHYNLGTAVTTVALGPGDAASCDVTNVDQLAHLKLVKSVTNDNGGTALTTDFWLAANGPTPISGAGTAEANVYTGIYTLTETNLPGYTAGTWNCNAGSLNGNVLTLSPGQNATCTIINSDNPPSLTLIKQVVNTHGGTALASAWTLTANGGGLGTISGTAFVTSGSSFKAGTYLLSESGAPSGYSAGAWNCVGGSMPDSMHVTVGLGQSATCTIINSDVAPSLMLVKSVSNTHGGTAEAANWLLSASAGPTPISGQGGATSDASFQAGTYFLSESGGPNGYAAGAWLCTGTGSQNGSSITLGLGQTATCTIINSDIAPILTLVKSVCNDNGGTAVPANWTLSATGGPTPISGAGGVTSGGTFTAGTYALSEGVGPAGYLASAWTCDGGTMGGDGTQITIGIGQAVTCEIDNDDIAPTLTLVKQVSNTHGGAAIPSNWLLSAGGPTSISGQGGVTSGTTFSAGTYTLSEAGGPANYTPSVWSCTNGVTVAAGQITLPLAKVTNCTIVNSDVGATLIVKKVVINDDGGLGVASNFSFSVNGGGAVAFSSGGSNTMAVSAGTYTVTEPAAAGYTTSYNNCSNVVLQNGATGTCTITNNDNPPNMGSIVTANTTCATWLGGSPTLQGSLLYALDGSGSIANSVTPGDFTYYSRVTIGSSSTLTVSETSNVSSGSPPVFKSQLGKAVLYTNVCGNTGATPTFDTSTGLVTFTGVAPGTYIIGVEYSAAPIVGLPGPTPLSPVFTFHTNANAVPITQNSNGLTLSLGGGGSPSDLRRP